MLRDAVPPTVEQLALERHLGRLQEIHKDTYSLFIASLVSSALCFVVEISLIIYVIRSFPAPTSLDGWIVGGGMVALWTGMVVWLALGNRNQRNDRTFLYENGLINKRGKDLQAIRWDEIIYIQTTTSESFLSTSTLHLRGGRTVETRNGTHRLEHFMKRRIHA